MIRFTVSLQISLENRLSYKITNRPYHRILADKLLLALYGYRINFGMGLISIIHAMLTEVTHKPHITYKHKLEQFTAIAYSTSERRSKIAFRSPFQSRSTLLKMTL